jgi:hypothetical protein
LIGLLCSSEVCLKIVLVEFLLNVDFSEEVGLEKKTNPNKALLLNKEIE